MPRSFIARISALAFLLIGTLALVGLDPLNRTVVAQEIDLHPAHTHAGTCQQPGEIISTLSPVSNAYVVDGESMVVPEIVGSANGVPVEFSSTTLPVPLAQMLAGQYHRRRESERR